MGGNVAEANQHTRGVDSQLASQSVESHSFQVDAKGAMSLGGM